MPYRCCCYHVQLSTCRNFSFESMFNRSGGGNRDCGAGVGGGFLRRSSHPPPTHAVQASNQIDTRFQTRDAFRLAGPLYNCHRQVSRNPFPWIYPTPFGARSRFSASLPTSLMPFRAMSTPTHPGMHTEYKNCDRPRSEVLTNRESTAKRHRCDVPNVSDGTSGHGYSPQSSFSPNYRVETATVARNWSVRDQPWSSVPHPSEETILSMRKIVESIRQWDYTDAGLSQLKKPQPGLEFSVATYNILAQCLLEDNIYLYKHCPPEILDWNRRQHTLMDEFKQSEADVLCLQEVQCEHYEEFFKPKLSELGYKGRYKKRTGNKKDGCAIFYKSSVFKLEKWTSVEYCKTGIGILDRDNVALIVMLRPRDGRETVCVANTHLLFNPGRGDIKLAQMRILLAEVDKFAFRHFSRSNRPVYHPVIMCGDMNSEPHCHLYKFVSTGTLNYEGLTAGDISGQAGGLRSGRFSLDKELVPSSLGISDHCQYVKTIWERAGGLKELREASEGHSAHETEPNLHLKFSSGRMSHQLKLLSAYGHKLYRLGGESEVTTHHHRSSCTVDYIFYSVHKKYSIMQSHKVVHRDVLEGSLQLLATYGLLSSVELKHLGGLPNAVQPSDHLPLMARFLLRRNS